MRGLRLIQAFRSLYVDANDEIFAANPARVVVHGKAGGTWTMESDAVAQLAGGKAGVFGIGLGVVMTFDGARWSPVRTQNDSYIRALAAGDVDVIAFGTPVTVPNPVTWFSYIAPH